MISDDIKFDYLLSTCDNIPNAPQPTTADTYPDIITFFLPKFCYLDPITGDIRIIAI
jgi:hypothetical protein